MSSTTRSDRPAASPGWSITITTSGPSAPVGKLLVTGAGPGGGPHVRIFVIDPVGNVTELGPGFFAYDAAFRRGGGPGSRRPRR